MSKSIIPFLAMLLISNYSIAQNKIIFKEIKGSSDCHQCYGKLVVSNGTKTDTIYGGQWGNLPDYFVKKIDGNELLFLESSNSFGGGIRTMELKIYSLSGSSFFKKIFQKEILLYRERNVTENGGIINYTYENNPIIEYQKPLKIINQITRKKCPETDDLKCTLLEKYTKIHYFWSPFVK